MRPIALASADGSSGPFEGDSAISTSRLFLRCGLGGILGGIVLIFAPEMNMFGRGVALLAIGCLSLVLWWTGIGAIHPGGKRKAAQGPVFEPVDPDVSADAATTTNLIREVRRERDRQKRAND
jgi:hypothetical protein